MSGQLRYSARLVLNVAEIDGRWHGGRDDLDEICRLAIERRRGAEIAIVTDHKTHERWSLELVGDEIRRKPL